MKEYFLISILIKQWLCLAEKAAQILYYDWFLYLDPAKN